MLDALNKLNLTAKDIEMIEAALHTQKKILLVQSEAGGSGARQKLTDLKYLMKRVSRTRSKPARQATTWAQTVRCMFFSQSSCSHTR